MSAQPNLLHFPVVCPQCGSESLLGLPFAEAASDLASGRQIQLYSRCHGRNWIASNIEVEQLREYFLCTLSVVEAESLPQPGPAKDPYGRMQGSATL